jgi:hypothetical protein
MQFKEGAGATSNTPSRLRPTNPLLNPVLVNKATRSHFFFLMQEDVSLHWCLQHISGASGTRFCMGKRLPGKMHCGVNRHALPDRGGMRYKFCPHADCFFILAGVSRGKPMAKKDPFMHWHEVPSHKRNTFMNAVRSPAEWTTLFNDILCKLEVEDSAMQQDNDVDEDQLFDEDPSLPDDPPLRDRAR